MKRIEYYTTNTLTYPSKEDYITVYAYLRGQVLWQGPAKEWPAVKGTLPPNHIVERISDDEALRQARIAYGSETSRLQEEFKRDLFDLEGVTDNPKVDACYALAWQYGHAEGLGEVANHFAELVELIK